MQTLQRGQKLKWNTLANASSGFTVTMQGGLPSSVLDYSCFGLDENGKLADERYFIFYNQKASPCSGIVLTQTGGNAPAQFAIDLARLPSGIKRLVFVITIDGAGEMRSLTSGAWKAAAKGSSAEIAEFAFSGKDFGDEKALIVAEVYFKDEWRVNAVGQGFAGGLSALLTHFGGTEVKSSDTPPAVPQALPPPVPAASAVPPVPPVPQASGKLSLQKKLQAIAPQLVNLEKPLRVALEKKKLQEIVARVALVLDTSGSMNVRYTTGVVQNVVERIFPLAVHFDDDAQLDCWAFAEKCLELPAVTGMNIQGFIDSTGKGWRKWPLGLRINEEPVVMRAVIEKFRNSKLPAYVVFISDGGVSASRAIEKLMIEASALPIFWQFVGIGGSNYGILESLDNMGGRKVDNASFFALDDLDSVSEGELYERLLNEFPRWLTEARAKGILRS